jgi:hypothetical protein
MLENNLNRGGNHYVVVDVVEEKEVESVECRSVATSVVKIK